MTTVKDAFEFIEPKLKNMMFTLERIADVEYSFDAPEWIDPEQFIEDYIKQSESGWMTFKTVITWEKGHNRFSNDLFDPETHEIVANKGDVIDTLYFSRKALKRILDNIIANAMAHGFTETTRNDYQLRFSWHTKGTNLVVEIENNGIQFLQIEILLRCWNMVCLVLCIKMAIMALVAMKLTTSCVDTKAKLKLYQHQIKILL